MVKELTYKVDLTDIADGDIETFNGKRRAQTYHFDTHVQALDIMEYLEAQGFTIADGKSLGVKWLIQNAVNGSNETDDNGGLVMEAVE